MGRKSPIPVLHVAGTKGKGSTCTFAESVLRAAGLKTGLFTSPHLLTITERIRINGQNCPDDLFLSCFWRYWDRMHEPETSGEKPPPLPIYFQTMLLVACDVFLRAEVDVVIMEVGIGGELDPTTAAISAASAVREDGSAQQLFACVACGVTLLDYDHTEILGDTLKSIGRQKAGIFRRGVPAFTIQQQEEGSKALREVAAKEGTELRVVDPLPDTWKLGIDADCQPSNAGLALRLAQQLLLEHTPAQPTPLATQLATFRALSDEEKRAKYAEGLESVRFLGRATRAQMACEGRAPIAVFMDGAHTPLSAQCCFRWFQKQLCPDASNAALIFNCGHSRDPIPLLCAFAGMKHESQRNPFRTAIFCPSSISRPTCVPQKTTDELLLEARAFFGARFAPRQRHCAAVSAKPRCRSASRSETLLSFWAEMDACMPTRGHLTNSANDVTSPLPKLISEFWTEMDACMPTRGHLTNSANDSAPPLPKLISEFWTEMDACMPTRGHLVPSGGESEHELPLLLPKARALCGTQTVTGPKAKALKVDKLPLSWQQSLASLWLAISHAEQRRAPPLPTPALPQSPPVVAVAADVDEALQYIRDNTQCTHVLVTGSFYLVANALRSLDVSS